MALTWTMILEAGGPNATPRQHRLRTPLIPYVFGIDFQVVVKRQATPEGDNDDTVEGYEALASRQELAEARDETAALRRASASARAWRD